MKKLLTLALAFSFIQVGISGSSLIAQKAATFRTIKHQAYQPGEKLTYRVHYGFIDAGEAVLEVKSTGKTMQGREMLHMVGTGKSLGSFNWFFKVRDRYETYVDKKGVFPWMFVRRVDEGGFKLEQDYVFNQQKEKVDNGHGKNFDAPFGVQDMLSSFYYARTIDLDHANIGDEFMINMFIDEELYPFKIKYLGDELVNTRKGKFNCHKIRPVVMKGRIWENEEDMTLWVTADQNKIPVKAKSNILVGSVTASLVGWEGVANPLSKVD